jgi:hypothetical protein
MYEIRFPLSVDRSGDDESPCDSVCAVRPDPDADGWYSVVALDGRRSIMRIPHVIAVVEFVMEQPDWDNQMPVSCHPSFCSRAADDGLWHIPADARRVVSPNSELPT